MIKATLKDHMGSDITVVNAARVSFGKESDWEWAYPAFESEWDDLADSGWQPTSPTCLEWKRLSDKDTKLIKYLAKHCHISPFGHAFASFHVKAPVFVARQLVKHKFLRWNEISRRYVDDEPEFYVPDVWRGRSADKKQGSEGAVDMMEFNAYGGGFNGYFGEGTLRDRLEGKREDDLEVYKLLIDAGVAPEQARMVLPQSTMTEWWWSGSLDAIARMCKLRCAEDTQYETRLVADQISSVMGDLFPVSWGALMDD